MIKVTPIYGNIWPCIFEFVKMFKQSLFKKDNFIHHIFSSLKMSNSDFSTVEETK